MDGILAVRSFNIPSAAPAKVIATSNLPPHEQFYLLRENSPVTWRAANCIKFLTKAVELWKQW